MDFRNNPFNLKTMIQGTFNSMESAQTFIDELPHDKHICLYSDNSHIYVEEPGARLGAHETLHYEGIAGECAH